jgi:hypothetical protein
MQTANDYRQYKDQENAFKKLHQERILRRMHKGTKLKLNSIINTLLDWEKVSTSERRQCTRNRALTVSQTISRQLIFQSYMKISELPEMMRQKNLLM